jgi:hypothetical protein
LPTAHAELVAILPSVTAPEVSGSSVPTLGSLSRKFHTKKHTLPGSRHLSTGSFLDYGPNASFAPSFEQDGVEVGQFALGEVMWSRWMRKSVELAPKTRALTELHPSAATKDVQMTGASSDEDRSQQHDGEMGQDGTQQIALDPLLERDQVAPIQDFMETLGLEVAIQELLERNKRALVRLEELQSQRLGGENGAASRVEVGSEEWDVGECSIFHHFFPG